MAKKDDEQLEVNEQQNDIEVFENEKHQIIEEKEEKLKSDLQASHSKEPQKKWYIVHTYSGYENKVKVNLEKRIEYMNMGDKIFRVEVHQKTITKVKDGKKQDR